LSWLEAVRYRAKPGRGGRGCFFEAVHSYAMAAMKAFEAISHCIDSIIVIIKITSIQLIFQSVNTLN
jgi:hypothetical protein